MSEKNEWKLVPVEPTAEMWAAVNKLDDEMAAGSYDGKGASIEQVWNCLVDAAPSAPGDAQDVIKLVHLAVAEDGGVRFMTGRKLPDGIESCELYAMPDYGRAPAELFRAPAAGDALPNFDIEAAAQKMAECMDYPWAHMPEQGRTHMRKYAQAVIDAALAAQVPQQGEA